MKLKVTGLKKEMSTTGTGASFAAGTGGQMATPMAFKIRKSRKDEIGEPFDIPNPSIPNRKSKFIDYKKIFEDAIKELDEKKQFNPVTDLSSSQADAGLNTGYDMDTQDAASVLELAKFAKDGAQVGDVDTKGGVKYTITNIDDQTGQISWDIDYVPAYDTVYKEFKELRSFLNTLAVKTDDTIIDDLNDEIKDTFNKYRTHIRKNYPDAYKKFSTNENKDLNERLGVSRDILDNVVKEFGAVNFSQMIISLRDENVQDEIVSAFEGQYPAVMDKNNNISEARYSQFKKKSQFRTPTQQLHMAVREMRRKIDEISKVVSFTERMRTELKASNEGMTYLNRTREAITKINEKLQELNNRIKGLTE
jgi:methyl-accepting chemotaxis protein